MAFIITYKSNNGADAYKVSLVHHPLFDGNLEHTLASNSDTRTIEWIPETPDEDAEKLNNMLSSPDSETRLLAYDIIQNKYNLR